MAKNVLVLTGSPRKGGNSNMMAEAFMRGVHSSGHKTTKFDTANSYIKGCTACDKCWSTGNACVVNDGFRRLSVLLEEADVIAFSTPLYWSAMSSQLKAAIDKLYSYVSEACRIKLNIEESVFLVCGECEGKEIFNPIKGIYRSIAEYMEWNDRGVIAVSEVHSEGDIEGTDALEKAYELGQNL